MAVACGPSEGIPMQRAETAIGDGSPFSFVFTSGSSELESNSSLASKFLLRARFGGGAALNAAAARFKALWIVSDWQSCWSAQNRFWPPPSVGEGACSSSSPSARSRSAQSESISNSRKSLMV